MNFEKFKQSQPKIITINASSPGEIFHGYGEVSARQARLLAGLTKPGEKIQIFKSDITIKVLSQEQSAIINSAGKRSIFTKDGIDTDLSATFFDSPTPRP